MTDTVAQKRDGIGEIRRATADEVEAYYREDYPDEIMPTTICWLGILDGSPVAMFGFARRLGKWYAIVDLKDGSRPYRHIIGRTAYRALDEAKKRGIKHIYAIPDLKETGSLKWMRRLGFERVGVEMKWSADKWRA